MAVMYPGKDGCGVPRGTALPGMPEAPGLISTTKKVCLKNHFILLNCAKIFYNSQK